MVEFIVLRVINKPDGTFTTPCYNFKEEQGQTNTPEQRAWSKYFECCGSAVLANNVTDTVMIFNQDGFLLEDPKCFRHPLPEPDPEPELEPETVAE